MLLVKDRCGLPPSRSQLHLKLTLKHGSRCRNGWKRYHRWLLAAVDPTSCLTFAGGSGGARFESALSR
ncbi:hypothetical protein XENOCAPTIV_003929 [Xenoophorus captivus]|uniref:Uncharacterized protein n=1 Tax=Xenoophorus captivus TaxID=1517983 RepID=A0ABV0RH41_9TELE